MLRYLSSGKRSFGRVPMGVHRRLNWEFYAVLKGRCGLLLPGDDKAPVRQSHLWVFPPGHEHGWHGGTGGCSVAVFHFAFVPDALQRYVAGKAYVERPLTPEQADAVGKLARQLRPHYAERAAISSVHFERALLDLTILVVGESLGGWKSASQERAEKFVNAALAWFQANVSRRPSLTEMAAAVNLSTSQLRRHFRAVRRQSPQEAISEQKLAMAKRLLVETDWKLEAVAAEGGFSGATDLCRFFKARLGCTPGHWRDAKSTTCRMAVER